MNEIICGDALDTLKTLPDGIVQTCVTSPPYYGLRDYGTETILQLDSDPECKHEWIHEGRQIETGAKVAQCKLCNAAKYDYQIGLEDTPEAYIARLVEVFREVRRVLRDDGTLWVNIGDSYAGANWRGGTAETSSPKQLSNRGTTAFMGTRPNMPPECKPKDLIGIPWMLAFALRADGWYLRSDIIWSKPNCMPESVTDRPTKAHEYIFLLSKSERYYYDAQAIAEPSSTEPHSHGKSKLASQFYSIRSAASDAAFREPDRNWGTSGTRNRRSVWTIPTVAYSESHFATFPPKLIEPCILAGSRPGDIVLDCFCGAGTVPLVALKYQRAYIGIELNADYCRLIEKRIHTTQPILWEVGA